MEFNGFYWQLFLQEVAWFIENKAKTIYEYKQKRFD